jgi:hypothetical protein
MRSTAPNTTYLWLDANPNEPDRDQQRAATERKIELAKRATEFFPQSE